MAYTENHRDLNKIKDRPIGGFTIRQLVSFAALVVIAIPIYAIMLSKKMDITIACMVICLIAFPVFYIGTYEDIFGRALEKIIGDKIKLVFKAKTKRPYTTDNSYEAIKNQQRLEKKYKEMARKELIRKTKHAKAKKNKPVKISEKGNKKKQGIEKTA